MLDVLYYPDGHRGPVSEYLDRLVRERPKAFSRIAVDLEVLGAEGLRSSQITIRPLGDQLWELKRSYDGIHYRIFFGVSKGAVWLLHSLEKKTAKTPERELELARRRLKEVVRR